MDHTETCKNAKNVAGAEEPREIGTRRCISRAAQK
jgi:hypothetical protein